MGLKEQNKRWVEIGPAQHQPHNGNSWELSRADKPQRIVRNPQNKDMRSAFGLFLDYLKPDSDNKYKYVLNLKLYPQLNFRTIIYT